MASRKKRTAKQAAATKKMLAANKRKRKGKKPKAKGPTKFQRFLLTNPSGKAKAKAKKLGWSDKDVALID